MAFATLGISQLFNAVNVRSEQASVFRASPFKNMWLVAAILFSLALHAAPICIPPLRPPFGTVPMGLADWAIAVGLASLVLWTEEIRKLFRRPRY